MRVIVSTTDNAPYGISKYIVDIIQVTLNKNQHKVKKLKNHLFRRLRQGKLNQMKYKFHMMS